MADYKGKYKDLVIPTINVNDTKVTISDIQKEQLEYIEEGEMLYCVETSKATEDFYPKYAGYVVLFVEDLDEVEVGKSAGMIFELKEDAEICLEEFRSNKNNKNVYDNINASKKAIQYAETIGFDLTLIKKDGIIKTEDIDNYLKFAKEPKSDVKKEKVDFVFNKRIKRVAILGAGRGSMQVIDLISHIDDTVAVALFDDDESVIGQIVDGVPVLDKLNFDKIAEYHSKGVFDYVANGIGGLCELRKKCFDELTKRCVPYINLIHPTSVIGNYVKMGSGNIILPMSHIGPHAEIGNDCFMTAKTSIEHHNIVGSHCTFGPGVMMSGSVTIGDCTKFGAGIFVEPLVKIGSNCKIASGSILTNHVPDASIVRTKVNMDIVPNK